MDEQVKSIRLDQLVVIQHPELSRSQAAKLISLGNVKVGTKAATKASVKYSEDTKLSVTIPSNQPTTSIDFKINYEDDDCVVIEKPLGILSHSKGSFNDEVTVANWLTKRLGIEDIDNNRFGIVHRLDRATSGVMICAKNDEAQKWLQKQFSGRKVKKIYYAVVGGELKQPEAIIDMPIERNPKKPQTFRVGINGKNAVTAYKVIETGSKCSLLELKPTTGRTHQLRVHLAQIGHPIVGDYLYNGPKADRLYLHAASLELTLPNKQRKVFSSPLPKEFNQLVKK
jgi:23S rRNA pseudouridine1911/1915/1917 synthase